MVKPEVKQFALTSDSRPGALNHEAQLLLTLNAIPDYGQYGFQEFTFQD